MHYKVIFLIISSDNEPVYAQMKELSPKYYSLFSDKIKFFFIENRQIDDQVIEDNNFLYINGNESFIPGIYQKSIKAIEYINNKYSYDYVNRTNLSTIWHMENLFKFLDIKPKERFAGGYAFQGFISGTGIIMSRDVGNIVASNPNSVYIGDDLAISQTIQSHGIHLYDITEYKWGFLIPKIDNLPSNCRYLNIDDNDFSDILNFRIKNGGDRSIDIYYFNVLLDKLYFNTTNNIITNTTNFIDNINNMVTNTTNFIDDINNIVTNNDPNIVTNNDPNIVTNNDANIVTNNDANIVNNNDPNIVTNTNKSVTNKILKYNKILLLKKKKYI